jgi:hypothetical protein
VGMLGEVGGGCVGKSPMWGICVVRFQWSLWLVSVVVMVASLRCECAESGSRRSQWSMGSCWGVFGHVWVSYMGEWCCVA